MKKRTYENRAKHNQYGKMIMIFYSEAYTETDLEPIKRRNIQRKTYGSLLKPNQLLVYNNLKYCINDSTTR